MINMCGQTTITILCTTLHWPLTALLVKYVQKNYVSNVIYAMFVQNIEVDNLHK